MLIAVHKLNKMVEKEPSNNRIDKLKFLVTKYENQLAPNDDFLPERKESSSEREQFPEAEAVISNRTKRDPGERNLPKKSAKVIPARTDSSAAEETLGVPGPSRIVVPQV